ncbi:helicase-associated domain-containing protein [Streptomyces specialis]|uniref:helicase-associated domain-containing protein n=1 Tax=Streptomyces specialis TaxID=498367 RepID=UPI00073F9B1A|nr:helicase-associated domain-containing protein [Streptomyces specialis]
MIPIAAESPLSAWLHRLDAGRLRDLLAARPDVARSPGPQSLGELACRLTEQKSVARALARLPLRCFQAAEALAALTALTVPEEGVPRDRLTALLGDPGPGVDAALTELTRYALAWRDDDGRLRLADPLRETWPAPLGLGPGLRDLMAAKSDDDLRAMLSAVGLTPPAARHERLAALLDHHRDPDRLAAIAAAAPRETRELLARHSRTVCEERESASAPALRWALDRGLLVRARHGYGPARMPAEVALALRGKGWRAPFAPNPPVPELTPVTRDAVADEAAAAASAFAGQAAAVLAVCAAGPPVRLKTGGVGSRELARLGTAARCGETEVRLVLETAHAAGLLARDGDRYPVTDAYDRWVERDPAFRLIALVRAWWSLAGSPTRSRDAEGRVLPALLDGLPPRNDRLAARRALLGAAARLPEGRGAADLMAFGATIAWHRPMARRLDDDSPPFATLLREAAMLGVLARGTLSPLGAALRAGDERRLAEAARLLLPAATEQARIGGDLTAVVTGTPSARLERLLDSVADRETRGMASVWRFTPASVRRALDAGGTAESIDADLLAVTRGPLPQPLRYLITDTARRHGRLQVVATACVIHAAEPALITEILHHRGLSGLGLRRLAPTVLVGGTAAHETLTTLRDQGYAPTSEAADGTVRVERPERARVRAVPPQRRYGTPRVDGGELDVMAVRLAAVRTETERLLTDLATDLPASEIGLLAHAIDNDRPVVIESRDERELLTIHDIKLSAPGIDARCAGAGDRRHFLLSRLVGVLAPR